MLYFCCFRQNLVQALERAGDLVQSAGKQEYNGPIDMQP